MVLAGLASSGMAQPRPALPPVPPPMNIPAPGPQTDSPYAPQPILPGGIVMPLFPPGSPYLNADKVKIPEVYNMDRTVQGRISSIVSIHNPSIEVHFAPGNANTGTAVILAAGGGHNTLNVGSEAADFVPWFYNHGVTAIILRNRLRRDGYNPKTDEVYDAQQAIRLVRAHAKEWNIDPNTAIPKNAPPAFITCAGTDDAVHAMWADQYFAAMLKARVPNVEMHIYGNGVHGNGLKDRGGAPFGTWQLRFIDWFRDLGFLAKPGVDTKAARDVAAHVAAPAK
jgi:acetyl esterase/lipase